MAPKFSLPELGQTASGGTQQDKSPAGDPKRARYRLLSDSRVLRTKTSKTLSPATLNGSDGSDGSGRHWRDQEVPAEGLDPTGSDDLGF